MRRGRLEVASGHFVATEELPEHPRLVGPVDQSDLPVLGNLPTEQLRAPCGVGVVDEAEVRLEAVENGGVRPEKRTIGFEQRLERRLPPGQLEFGSHLVVGDVPGGEVVGEWGELEVAEGRHQRHPVLQVVEHVRFGGQRFDARAQFGDTQVRQLGVAGEGSQRFVEHREVVCDRAVRGLNLGDSHRYLRRHTLSSESLPQNALLLDANEGGMQVRNMHTGTHVLPGELLEASTVRAGHLRRFLPRSRRRDEFAQGPVEDHGKESVEGVAQVDEQLEIDTEFIDGVELAEPRAVDEVARGVEQPRKRVRVQSPRNRVRVSRRLSGGELRSVPGRVAWTVLELPKTGSADHGLCRRAAVGREGLDGGAAEARSGRRRGGEQREAAQLGDTVEHADAEHLVWPGEGAAVIEQHLAQPHQGLVHFGDLRLDCLFAPRDRPHDVPAQRTRGHRKAR